MDSGQSLGRGRTRPDLSNLWDDPRPPARAVRLQEAPEGKEACPERAGEQELYKKPWRRSSPGFTCCLSLGPGVLRESNGRGQGSALGLPNAGTICSRCSCNMLELQNS